jgi:lipopolysaccharide transport system permease protein
MTAILRQSRDFWEQKTLAWVLTRRTLIARYRGTALGFLWTFLHPLLTFLVYVLVFGVFVPVGVDNYPAFLLSGLLPWSWFATSVSLATTSILGDAPWIRQGAFASSISPFVVSFSALINFALTLPILLGLLLALGVKFTPWLLLLPVLALLQFVFILGISLAVASLAVRYRDVAQIVQVLLPLLFFMTPIIYSPAQVPPGFTWILSVNPMAQLSSAWQSVLHAGEPPSLQTLGILSVWAVVAYEVGSRIYELHRDRIPEEL